MGGYDLHGNYYPDINDAINAEMAQCNEIDNRINQERIRDLERRAEQRPQSSTEEEIHHLWLKIKELSERIEMLEKKAD